MLNREKQILQSYLYNGWYWIARDNSKKEKRLYVFSSKPIKMEHEKYKTFDLPSSFDMSIGSLQCELKGYSDLFQFVTFENSPLKISDILRNCEGIDDAK